MIDESIIKCVNELDKSLNTKGLVSFMQNSGIVFKDRSLKGPVGIATTYCIYLDIDKLTNHFPDRILYFVILHEMGHLKRITKLGKDKIISLLSLEDFDEFCEHVIGEELIADRYGCYLFWLLNKQIYPRYLTQELYLPENKLEYRRPSKLLFGVVKNSEENYKELIKTLIHD